MITPTNVAVLLSLSIFGCAYSWVVYSLGERKAGYVAIFVVVGVLVTLAGFAMLDTYTPLTALACFVASGTPMVAGEIIQHMRAREHAIQAHRERAIDAAEDMYD